MPMNVAKIYSTLGNPSSLIPLAVKDISSSIGMATGSYITGKEEGQDRLIDELGTEVIWLLGIPFFKKLFDVTAFKAFDLDANFDVRNFKDKKVLEKIKEYAPSEKIKKNIETAVQKEKLFKGSSVAKFLISTGMTITSYLLLTIQKQKYTENKIKENLIKEHKASKKSEQEEKTGNLSNPSFKGLGNVVEYFAFNPVRNMWIIDGSITAERLKNSRNSQELIGYAIKEASLLCFMYYAGGKIQEFMEKQANKKYNKEIGLDARVLEDNWIKKAFEDGSIEKSLEEFNSIKSAEKGSKLSKDSVELYEFLHKNPENLVVKTAEQSDIIKLHKETGKIDTRKYIDFAEVEGVNKKLSTLYEQFKASKAKGETSEQFFKGVKKLKRGSIRTNIFASIFALGVFTPAMMLLKRFSSKDDQEFQTKKDIREQLIKEGIIA